MCVVSNIVDVGRMYPRDDWDWTKWREFQDLIEKARRFDEMTKQKDCEDPAKKIWMEEVERRLERLEDK